MGALLGIQAQGTGRYNYQVDGTVIPPGAPVVRNFVDHEGELYAQDTWKVTRSLTVTAGLRVSLAPPVYEANGQQASTNIPIADWLAQRMNLADQGLSQNGVTPITFIPASASGGRSIYPNHTNWAPRVGIAYSPKADSGISKFLFGGPGKTSIRVGGGMYYDLIGQPLAQTFSGSQFGLSSSLSNPANTLSTAQAPRFTTFFTVPSQLVPPTPKGGLPVTYPASGTGSFAITNSIDDKLKAPYTMNLDFSIGRDFGHGLFVQGAYVGRLSRHSLVQRDLSEATDLRDPKSGQDYFSAMAQLATALDLSGVTIANLPKIPFFENMWSTAATGGFTATQIWGLDYHGDPTRGIKGNSNAGDFTNTLNNADNAANCGKATTLNSAGKVTQMACGIYGPWMMFNPQFSALSANSSIGKGNYHAMQWTIRKRFSGGLLFDLNYTWSKSIDLGSTDGGRLVHRVHHQYVQPQPDARCVELRHHSLGQRQLCLPAPVRPRQEVRKRNEQGPRRDRRRLGDHRPVPADLRPAVHRDQRPALADQLEPRRQCDSQWPADSGGRQHGECNRYRRTQPVAGSGGGLRGVPRRLRGRIRRPHQPSRRRGCSISTAASTRASPCRGRSTRNSRSAGRATT